MKDTLTLTLKKQWFDIMLSGKKTVEYREPSQWIRSRLFYPDGTKKKYKFIKFINGYGNDKPYFIAKYHGFLTCKQTYLTKFSGVELLVKKGNIGLWFGDIIETGNIRR